MITGPFKFGDIHSSHFKLVSNSGGPRPITSPMRDRSISIYGKNGLIDYGNNNYDAKPIKRHISYVGDDYRELRVRAREISAWLTTETWQKLIFDDEKDKYYLARVYDAVELETLYRLGEADITFICQPFAYRVLSTGAKITFAEANFPWKTAIPWEMSNAYTFTATGAKTFDFDNPGSKKTDISSPEGSKFDIIVTGSFTALSLSLNGKTLSYIQPVSNGTLIFNNVDMEVTLNGSNALNEVAGDIDSFLAVKSGINTIHVSGTGLNISVKIDFLPEWW